MSKVREKYPMVSLITYIIGLFDPYGVHHSERVADLCVTIGKQLELDPEALEILELSALLHDIGKLAIPEATRSKPGPLLEAEQYMMRQHADMGLRIIQRMNGDISPRVHLAIYHHHEDWSGSGYPAGLQGEMIPLEARIIRIADTFDAITHSRGYRVSIDSSSALQKMEQEQEELGLFDPHLFRVFLEIMRKVD